MKALLLLALALPVQAGEPLRFIAATNHTEPLSTWSQGQLRGGLVKELSDLLAAQLGRPALYLSRPSKRAPEALRAGEADLFCYTRREWIGDDFHFTEGLVPNAGVVAGAAGMAALQRLEDLKGERVGTVLGYRYGEVAVRGRFLREDAPDMGANLRKLAAGRVRYAISDAISLRGAQRAKPEAGLHLALALAPYETHCALSRRSRLTPAQLDAAVRALKRNGTLQALVERYR